MTEGSILRFLSDALLSSEAGWGIGCHGALAEFIRDPEESCHIALQPDHISAVTARGAIRLVPLPEMRAVELVGAHHRETALCLPLALAQGNARAGITELGPDRDALLPEHKDQIIFDLGIGAVQIEACVRTGDPALIEILREHAGKSPLEGDNPAIAAIIKAGPHRVYRSSLGRIEVYQPIPASGGHSPEGPHTHFNPHALRHGKAYSPRSAIPTGWAPCASLYFTNGAKRDADRHAPRRDGERLSLVREHGDLPSRRSAAWRASAGAVCTP